MAGIAKMSASLALAMIMIPQRPLAAPVAVAAAAAEAAAAVASAAAWVASSFEVIARSRRRASLQLLEAASWEFKLVVLLPMASPSEGVVGSHGDGMQLWGAASPFPFSLRR
eukprot:NODE_6672_length_491_cov_99.711009.p2 GENE.NODE_6672_length_491_cov_99.711009~~NODE_6672_length_491_cov_99.711009.p2  ORF type:complete len:112 (-),score=19.49 NODE_6672_length_491_cov_99.711009:123-458(-)